MANDNSTPSQGLDRDSTSHTDTLFHAEAADSVFDAVQLAQADGAAAPAAAAAPGTPQQVGIPAGAHVVRVPVTPGEVLVLGEPFNGDATLIGRVGDGNLAIKVGDVTVILQGYVDANQQTPVTVETANGKPVDVATMLASTDPTLDIQTAAGPGDAAGAQGADNSGAIFAQLGNGNGLGGLNAVGGQDATELSYGLIDNSIRQDLADALLSTTTFGFSVGAISGGHSEKFFRDPAETNYIGSFADFMSEYQDAVENPGNPLFAGWADFQGTGATGTDFASYLDQTRRTVTVDASFTGATGDLVLDGVAAGLTSNSSPLHVELTDQGHTMFVRRDSDNALVAVVHVEGPSASGEFTIDTFMINRLDHPDAGTGDAGRDDMIIGVDFTVYDGPSPLQGSEGNDAPPSSPSLDGKFEVSFEDDVPLFDNVTYHNLDGGFSGGDQLPITDSTTTGLIDEDWLNGGANDKGKDGTSNAGDNGDTAGGPFLEGKINVNFGADGPSRSDDKYYEISGKHAFVLDTSTYTQGEVFPYNGGTLSSGGQTLYVLSVGPDHLVVGIPAPEDTDAVATPIFTLTLNQDTGVFGFQLQGPLDHGTDLIFAEAAGAGSSTEETIPLDFAVTAFDDDGDYVPAAIHIEVNDDQPVARDDSDSIAAGTYGPALGNVMTAIGEDSLSGKDSQGGDTAAVTGVAAGKFTADQDGHVGTEIQGTYGKLTLQSNGEYIYTRDPGTKGGQDDYFTYTLTDKDGDTSTATLTIHIGDAGVTVETPSGRDGTIVYEQGLPERNGEPAGSGEIADGNGNNNSDPSEQTTGIVTITALDGVASLQVGGNPVLTLAQLNDLGSNPVSYSDSTGELVLTGFDVNTGKLSYTYTLTDNTLADPDSVSFALKVTDQDGSEGDGTLKINIIDDHPTAKADTDSVDNILNAATGNVISGADTDAGTANADVQGADGATVTLLASTAKFDTDIDNSDGLTVQGQHGTLTMSPDGTYTYTRADDKPLTATDEFLYVLTDADGDQSPATLTIKINDQDVRIGDLAQGGDVTVDEDDLSASRGPNESAGSDTTPESTTQGGTFTIFAPDGVKDLTIDNHPVISGGVFSITSFTTSGLGNTLAVTAYNPGTGEITYTYTLNDNKNHFPGNGENNLFEGLQVKLTDTDGDQQTATLTAKIIDDVPTANADTKSIGSGGTVGGNVESNDVFGADGKLGGNGVVGVATGSNTAVPVAGGLSAPIVTALGTLTLNADGSYNYTAKPNVGGVDHFVYTISDADGDLSTTTLDITVSNVRLATDTKSVTVDEAALDLNKDGNDLQAGTVTGSNPGSTDETKSGQLVLGAGVTATAGNYAGTFGTLHVNTDGSFTYTLTKNMDSGAIAGANTVLDAEVFSIQIQDAGGNTATDTIKINVIDDVPSNFDPQDQSLLNAPPGGVITGALNSTGHYGADGFGSIVFSGGANGDKAMLADGVTPITWQGKDILLSGFGTDTLTGFVDLDNDKSVDPGEAVFTAKLNGAADSYTFTLIKDIDDGARVDFTDLSAIKAGNTSWLGVGSGVGDKDSRDLLYTAFDMTKQDVNTSKNDIGSGDQWIDKGEGLRMDFVQGLTGTFKNENGFDFAQHYQVSDYQFAVSQVGGGGSTSLRLTAADVTNNKLNDGTTTEADFLAQTLVAITAGELTVLRGATDITNTLVTIDYTDGGKNDGGVIITGLQGGDIVKLHDTTGFDRVEVDSNGGTQFSISGSQVLQTVAGVDLDLKFQTTLKDGDGDTSSGQYIGINLQTDDGTSHTFHGGPGNDSMSGGSGSDLIFGEAGNDTMLYDSADKYDGGAGFDRVLVTTGGNSITYDATKFLGIEMVDLGDANDRTGAGNQNTLALNATDVVGTNAGTVAGHQVSFFVIGDTTGPTAADRDNVHLSGFGSVIASGAFTDPVTGLSHSYDVYQSTANAAVKVAVEQGLDVI